MQINEYLRARVDEDLTAARISAYRPPFKSGVGMAWWAVYCEARREAVARDALRALSLDVFFPFNRVTRRVAVRRGVNAYRVREVDEPVWPRYIFADSESVAPVREARGVLCVVAVAGQPVAVPDAVIAAMRGYADPTGLISTRDASRLSNTFHARVGDRFRFKFDCAFAGLVGIVDSLDALDVSGTVRVWVDMFGASRRIAVGHEYVGRVIGGPAVAETLGVALPLAA